MSCSLSSASGRWVPAAPTPLPLPCDPAVACLASCHASPCSLATWGTHALVSSSVKIVFCRRPFHSWLWKTGSHANSQRCRRRMRRRDQGCIKSYFSQFIACVAFLLNPVSLLLYPEVRKCYLLFCIISLEIIPGYPASNTGTPLVRYSSEDHIGLPWNLRTFSFKSYTLSKMFNHPALKEDITNNISVSF